MNIIELKSETYSVHIAAGASTLLQSYIQSRPATSRSFILVDSNTGKHCLPRLVAAVPALSNVTVITLQAGEANKHLASVEGVIGVLLSQGADRHSLLVNLGGGLITDLGGLSASLFMRGIDFVNLPTSLLGMVDAAVGGKTGVNFSGNKNSIGLFSNPSKVIVDLNYLESLPEREFRSGVSEVIKHQLISGEIGKTNWQAVPWSQFDWATLIAQSIAFKQNVVASDFQDHHLRKILNFGHTVGHALETYSLTTGLSPLLHGEAVALGMQLELVLSHHLTELDEKLLKDYLRLIQGVFPELSFNMFDHSWMNHLQTDKKNQDREIRCVLLEGLGKVRVDVPIAEADIHKALQYLVVNSIN